MHEPNFTKLGKDIETSQHCTFVSDFGYLAAFSNACGANLSDVLNDAKFFLTPPPVKIRGGVSEIPIVEALSNAEPSEYI